MGRFWKGLGNEDITYRAKHKEFASRRYLPTRGSQEERLHCSTQHSGAGTDSALAKQLGEVKDGSNGRKPESGVVRRTSQCNKCSMTMR